MRAAAAALLSLWATIAPAQDSPFWERSAKGKVSFTQAGFYRWHDGGVSSLALSVGINGGASRTGRHWTQEHDIHLSYGLVKQNGLDLRKAEDVIHVHSSVTNPGRAFLGILEPAVAVTLRTQFAAGFDYSKSDSVRQAPRISGFLAPATLVETIGFRVDPFPYASIDFGLAGKQTIVTNRPLRARYKVRQDRALRSELGVSAITRLERELVTNVHLDSTLQLFASFNKPDVPDLLWEVDVTMTVNRWLHVNLEYVAKLDRDISKSLQMRELISLALSFVLI